MSNNLKVQMGDTLYGVTAHNYVVPLRVISMEEEDSRFHVIKVEAVNKDKDFDKTQVRLVFKELFLMDGEIHTQSVFLKEEEALRYALKGVKNKRGRVERNLQDIGEREKFLEVSLVKYTKE